MSDPIEIRSVRPDEWPAAFELALQQVPAAERPTRLANALALLGAGEIEPAGIFVALASGDLAGVQVCIPLRGSSGLFWLPQVQPAMRDGDLARRLVAAALAWLPTRGAKIAQAMLHPSDAPHADALTQCGFRHITRLQYMSHDLDTVPDVSPTRVLRLQPFAPAIEGIFQQTLLRTYEQTLDCPELNGVRTIEEVIDGHRAQGLWRAETWWLASMADTPAGVVLLTELADVEGYDLSYVGVTPEFRGRGIGKALARHAIGVAKALVASQLLLAVDERNLPARRLYESLGFRPTECREVFLRLF